MIRFRVVVSDGVYSLEKVRRVWGKWDDNKAGTLHLCADRLPLKGPRRGHESDNNSSVWKVHWTDPPLGTLWSAKTSGWQCVVSGVASTRDSGPLGMNISSDRVGSLVWKSLEGGREVFRQIGSIHAVVEILVEQLLWLKAEAASVQIVFLKRPWK